MKRKLLSMLLVIVMILSIISVYTIPVSAAVVTGTTNKYTYIRMAPYWTAEVVDNLTAGSTINIIEREYTYLYIEYQKNTRKAA